MKYKDMSYDEFLALSSVIIFEDIKILEQEKERLERRILGLKSTINNLNEKLYKRNEGYVYGKR